jgi:8-oxo-dGTP pyrophosphatase MutT (NUDIX family)
MSLPPIRIVAAVVSDAAGRTLLVRKRGTQAFMQAGGKIEPGEEPTSALARELAEELGCTLVHAEFIGTFTAEAANEPGRDVVASVFRATVRGAIAARAEIAELVWIDAAGAEGLPVAPLTRDHILPLLVAERLRVSA